MCGIAGWYRRNGSPVPRDAVVRQCDGLVQRGPDDSGYLIDGDFGFGMRRLSIIDIATGHQPIASPNGRYAIVLNGEIVNHPQLRRELDGHYDFRTDSDTETLLAAFLRWGDDAWLRLEGMYAAAIWDRAERRLTLARDPLGIKPLYVTSQRGGLAFASEIGALRVLPRHEFSLDERGVHDFLSFGHVLRPRTIFSEIRSVDPGHVLRIGPFGPPSSHCFWTPRLAARPGPSERDWIAETRERVLRTVSRHMISDVPIGAFLSGGVDSGAIAAAMARSASVPFTAFTAGFPGSKIDETEAATRVAAHLGCRHVVLPIEARTAAEVLPAVQSAFDEPSAANSAIPLWYLARTAAQHVKVVLCGEGGDELFLGYNRQRWARRMGSWAPTVRALGGLGFIESIPDTSSRKMNYLLQHARRFRDGAMLESGYQRFFAAVTIMPPPVRHRIYSPEFSASLDGDHPYRDLEAEYFPLAENASPLGQFMLGDLSVHMPASLLNRLDRATMAHSLEARVPFLSHSFVEWALTVPDSMKLRGRTGKYVLRKAVEPWLPAGALDGRKLGFQMPLADWFTGGFNDFAREAWHSSGAADAGFLDREAVDQLFVEHRSGTRDHGRILYALAMFACWWERQGPGVLERSSADRAVCPEVEPVARSLAS